MFHLLHILGSSMCIDSPVDYSGPIIVCVKYKITQCGKDVKVFFPQCGIFLKIFIFQDLGSTIVVPYSSPWSSCLCLSPLAGAEKLILQPSTGGHKAIIRGGHLYQTMATTFTLLIKQLKFGICTRGEI